MKKVKFVLYSFIGVLVSVIFLFKMLPWKVSKVLSNSMKPTFCIGDYIVIDKTMLPEKNDIVVFYKVTEFENGEKSLNQIIKRVLAVSGDNISSDGTYLFVNGLQTEIKMSNIFEDVIPEGCYFVVGDNYQDSLDSRYWAEPYVHRNEIIGVVVTKKAGL